MNAVIDHFQKYILLNEEERNLILPKVSHKSKKTPYHSSEGMVCKHYSFVVEGCFRMYGIDDKGYEHNIQFAAEGDWISDIGVFIRAKRASYISRQ
jgi:CRP-like cAMP-binding protein